MQSAAIIENPKFAARNRIESSFTKPGIWLLLSGVFTFILGNILIQSTILIDCQYQLGECPAYYRSLQIIGSFFAGFATLLIASALIIFYLGSLDKRKILFEQQKIQQTDIYSNIKIKDPKNGQKILAMILFIVGFIFSYLAVGSYYGPDETFLSLCFVGLGLQLYCVAALFQSGIHQNDSFLLTLSILIIIASLYSIITY